MSKGRRGAPTPEELRLWQAVTRSVAPLGRRPAAEAAKPEKKKPENKDTAPARPAHAAPRPSPKTPAAPPAPGTIDRRTISRLARGTIAIDARLDLHGMTQAAAHGRLIRFLREAQADGARMALVITGKGRPAGEAATFGEQPGVLRRAVPMWLASAETRPLVVGLGAAAPAHGGAGALYVRIRRKR